MAYVCGCRCADNDCDDQIPQYLLKSLLSDENFDRYERLHLQVRTCTRTCRIIAKIQKVDAKSKLMLSHTFCRHRDVVAHAVHCCLLCLIFDPRLLVLHKEILFH